MISISDKIKAIDIALEALHGDEKNCNLCPRRCGIDRSKQKGFCGVGNRAVLYTAFLHRGEEPCISGTTGSGAMFFSGCSLKCVYCQNYKFSHTISGEELLDEALAHEMLTLQKEGAANINMVTPTHVLLPILKALSIAYQKGLSIPIVYNTSGYELASIIRLLQGIVDVYLVDIKYADPFLAERLSSAVQYPSFAQGAFLEMYSQTHACAMEQGLMKKGIILRHLVLPGYVENSINLLRWLQDGGFSDCFLSLMFQYRPYFKAMEFPEIARTVSKKEYKEVTDFFYSYCKDIANGWIQEIDTDDSLAGINF